MKVVGNKLSFEIKLLFLKGVYSNRYSTDELSMISELFFFNTIIVKILISRSKIQYLVIGPTLTFEYSIGKLNQYFLDFLRQFPIICDVFQIIELLK